MIETSQWRSIGYLSSYLAALVRERPDKCKRFGSFVKSKTQSLIKKKIDKNRLSSN